MIKVGKIELDDWAYPCVNGIIWSTPYRFTPGTIFNGSHYLYAFKERTMIFLDCRGVGSSFEVWAEFYGELSFLQQFYSDKKFASYSEAKEWIDIFLHRISGLTRF